jgi:hypothetical protein
MKFESVRLKRGSALMDCEATMRHILVVYICITVFLYISILLILVPNKLPSPIPVPFEAKFEPSGYGQLDSF